MNLLSLYSTPIAQCSLSMSRLQRGPSVAMPPRKHSGHALQRPLPKWGERRAALRQPVPAKSGRGFPPAKTSWRTHRIRSAYRSHRQGRDEDACAERGRVLLLVLGRAFAQTAGLRQGAPAKDLKKIHGVLVPYRSRWLTQAMVLVPDAGAPSAPPLVDSGPEMSPLCGRKPFAVLGDPSPAARSQGLLRFPLLSPDSVA